MFKKLRPLRLNRKLLAAISLGTLLTGAGCSPKTSPTTVGAGAVTKTANSGKTTAYQVPVEYFTLKNGLKVVLSPDKTAPIVTVAVYYNIGFRNEPKNRTGFAHLFEHMMFQGSANLPKGEFDKITGGNGGLNNGSTRFDFTNYFEIMPAHTLETVLWAEADRMRGLDINQASLKNQQEVVKNEVKVNVLNQPYGGFPWLDMPQFANKNWYNAHNFYGDLKDLDAANLEDVKSFFKTYYSPSNAALVVVGDLDVAQAKAWVSKYFENIPSAGAPPQVDLTEPRQEKEQRFTKDDKLATKPALAFAYHMPDKNTPEYYAMGLLDQILLQGHDSRLYQALVQERGYTGGVDGGINSGLGNMFNYNGPMLWDGSLVYDNNISADSIMAVVDREIKKLETTGINQQLLDLALVKMRSSLYDQISQLYGFGKADLLASFALFDNDPSRINKLESEFKKVTPALMQKTIREYLRPSNRTILIVNPLAKS